MDKRSKIDMQKVGVLTVEKHTIHLKLFGGDCQRFQNDPSGFLQEHFQQNGERVRKLTGNFRERSAQSPSANPSEVDMMATRTHVVWPDDEASYMWVDID